MLSQLIFIHVLIEFILIKIGVKLSNFCQKKFKILERWGLHPQTSVPPLNITGIVRMRGKMCSALNQFFTQRHKEAKLPRKIWSFSEKNNDLLFLSFCKSESFEKKLRGKSQTPSSLKQPCWNSHVTFCPSIPYVKFYEVFFSGRSVRAHSLIGNRH